MLEGKSILVIGARAGGYGASIAQAAAGAGARVFGTSLNPLDPKEQSFFADLGVILIDIPLRYSFDQRQCVFEDLPPYRNLAPGARRHPSRSGHPYCGGRISAPTIGNESRRRYSEGQGNFFRYGHCCPEKRLLC